MKLNLTTTVCLSISKQIE